MAVGGLSGKIEHRAQLMKMVPHSTCAGFSVTVESYTHEYVQLIKDVARNLALSGGLELLKDNGYSFKPDIKHKYVTNQGTIGIPFVLSRKDGLSMSVRDMSVVAQFVIHSLDGFNPTVRPLVHSHK